jgi:glycerol-3-phosphate dehydrogenase (NAD(P)+)
VLLARGGNETLLWARSEVEAADLTAADENARHRPGLRFPDSLEVTAADSDIGRADLVVLAVPSDSLRANLERLAPSIAPDATVLSAVKGIEPETSLRMSEVIESFGVDRERILVLSGPNFAGEIAAGLPAATVIAGRDEGRARVAQTLLNGPTFRVYTSDDPTGVEIGGALKNVVAIACGLSDGLGYGENAKAALITRGLAEITRLGVAAGAKALTFLGLAGLGDLVLTCGSDISRNRRLGLALAGGAGLDEALSSIDGVVEGAVTARALPGLARRYGVEMPICAALHTVLYEGKPAREAGQELMARAAKAESG